MRVSKLKFYNFISMYLTWYRDIKIDDTVSKVVPYHQFNVTIFLYIKLNRMNNLLVIYISCINITWYCGPLFTNVWDIGNSITVRDPLNCNYIRYIEGPLINCI
jgi:hypothetical protein